MVIVLRNGRVNRISRFRNNARETSALRFHGIRAENAFTPRSSRYLNYPSNFIGHGHPNKPANGERMIRQGVAVWRSDRALPIMGARSDVQPDSTPADRALDNGTLFTTGTGAALGKGAAKIKKEMSDVSGTH